MTKAAFLDEMSDEAVTKLIVTNEDQPVSLVTLTWDLQRVSWVSPEFYTSRYPQQAAAGRLFYITNMLTDPGHQGREAFLLLTDEIYRLGVGGVIGSDSCSAVLDHGFMEAVRRRMQELHSGGGTVQAVDSQTFFAIDLA